MKPDSRVDAYIAKAPSFAQPILREVRARIHKACPAVEETIKWNVPFYVLGGTFIASMAAFKKHTKVGVWTDMKPKFVDVSSVAELPPAKQFAQSLAGSQAHATSASAAPRRKTAAKSAAKTTAPKTTAAKKTPVKQAGPKQAKRAKTAKAATKRSAAKTSRK